MAKQKGIVKLVGTISDIVFFKSQDGYMAREHIAVSKERIATDPAFARTRENMAEFARAGKAGAVLRTAIRDLLQNAKDSRVISRLVKQMMTVVKADATSIRGQRNVIDGEAELLQGFDCNINAKLGATLFAPYTAAINRTTGKLTVTIPPFVPANSIVAPDGATHYSIVSMGAEVDFEAASFITDEQGTGVQPINGTATTALTLTNSVTAASTHPLFLLLGIQFSQLVNGAQYPLKNGAFNALSIVQVNGQ